MEKVKGEGLYSLVRHAQMQYRYEIEHAPANFRPAGEEQKKLKAPALMEYGSVIGARSR